VGRETGEGERKERGGAGSRVEEGRRQAGPAHHREKRKRGRGRALCRLLGRARPTRGRRERERCWASGRIWAGERGGRKKRAAGKGEERGLG
jgi:hypothetical protein